MRLHQRTYDICKQYGNFFPQRKFGFAGILLALFYKALYVVVQFGQRRRGIHIHSALVMVHKTAEVKVYRAHNARRAVGNNAFGVDEPRRVFVNIYAFGNKFGAILFGKGKYDLFVGDTGGNNVNFYSAQSGVLQRFGKCVVHNKVGRGYVQVVLSLIYQVEIHVFAHFFAVNGTRTVAEWRYYTDFVYGKGVVGVLYVLVEVVHLPLAISNICKNINVSDDTHFPLILTAVSFQ